MERFWQKRLPRFGEEEAYYFIKDMLKEYGEEDDYYARGGGSGSGGSSRRRGGSSSSSYHEGKEEKLEALKEVYYALCDFFEEIGIDIKNAEEQMTRRRR